MIFMKDDFHEITVKLMKNSKRFFVYKQLLNLRVI